jgi:hypothetical protein
MMQSEISDEKDDGDDVEADLEVTGRTGAGWFEGSAPRDDARVDVTSAKVLTGGQDETTEPEGGESRGREEVRSSEAVRTRADAAAVFGLKIGFEIELRAL